MFDMHIHTAFSADCETPIEVVIDSAIDKGLQTIAITDHIDYEYHNGMTFEFDPNTYHEKIAELQESYRERIEILKGVELGIKPDILDKCRKLMNEASFDFVIASMHACENEDFYFGNFFDEKTPEAAMKAYLDEMYEMLQSFNDFDVIGHIDLPKRYNSEVANMNIEPLIPAYKKVFKHLVERGKGIEVNTSGLRQAVGRQFPDKAILKAYYECGGRIITLGSDSHAPDTLGKDFDKVIDILSEIGFLSVCTFKNRQVRHHGLDRMTL